MNYVAKFSTFQLINYFFKDMIKISNFATTQPARDVPGTSPEGPIKVLTSETSRGPSGDSQETNTKIDDLMKKLFFRCNSPCFTQLFLFFTAKTNIQKVETGTSTDTHKHIKLTLTG